MIINIIIIIIIMIIIIIIIIIITVTTIALLLLRAGRVRRVVGVADVRVQLLHARHILPPSEIDLGLCLAVFAGSGGKYIFHRIG